MTISPRLLKGGLITMDPGSGAIQRVISLQYNPDTLTRTLTAKATGGGSGTGGASGERSQALRLTGPAVETYTVEAELDLADQLEHSGSNRDATTLGLHPQLAALELLVQPSAASLVASDALSRAGRLEIIPVMAPLTLFVWSPSRTVPVRLTEFRITEEAFDPALNPIRAKVNLGMRVLTVDDLGFDDRGGTLFLSYLRSRESLAARARGALDQVGGLGGRGFGGGG
ncbi:hypothetical protein UK82_07670 [Frankia sp. ACN1ag]|nr:hypothetical protein UK82_07670 [Frankia sp. ACN1ag]